MSTARPWPRGRGTGPRRRDGPDPGRSGGRTGTPRLPEHPLQALEQVLQRLLELRGRLVLGQQRGEPAHEWVRGQRAVLDVRRPLRVVQRADRHAALGDLEQQVAEQEAGVGPVGGDRGPVAEAVGGQRVEEGLQPAEAAQRRSHPRRGRRPRGDEREDGRVGDGDPPDPVREPLQVVLPAVLGRQVHLRVAVELVDDQFHDAVEQVVAAGDVPVQRHPLDAEVGAHAAHRERLEPVLVDELDGRGEHPAPVERGPDGAGRTRPHRTRVGGAVIGHSDRGLGVVCHGARLPPSSRSARCTPTGPGRGPPAPRHDLDTACLRRKHRVPRAERLHDGAPPERAADRSSSPRPSTGGPMINETQIQQVIGTTAIDADGDKIGKVSEVYLDDETGRPEWATVHTGLFGTKETFVPLAEAELSGEQLRVPYDKAKVKDAPKVDTDGHLSPQEEQELYRYYGLGAGTTTETTTQTTTGTAGTAGMAGTAGVAGTPRHTARDRGGGDRERAA